MTMKFAANISTMFNDIELPLRFAKAKQMGFKFIEAQFLYDYNLQELRKAQLDSGLEFVLINAPARSIHDNFQGKGFGLTCIPGQEVEFINSLHQAISYANELRCKRIHIIAGLKPEGFDFSYLEATYIENLRSAKEMLEDHDIIGVIEPICNSVKENYFLDSFETAIKCVKAVNSPHIRLLLDVFHLHNIQNVEALPTYLPFAEHIQVSQSPKRDEPFAEGQIDYKQVFQVVKDNNYQGYIGLEYSPSGGDDSFQWLKDYGF